jgi:dTDP-4-amino-4,6-dideoxygalactose transaminase
VLNVKFPHLPSWHQARRNNAALYDKLFAESGLSNAALQADAAELAAVTSGAKPMPVSVITPTAMYSGLGHADHHIYHQYIVRVQRRDELRSFLASKSIGTEIYYPVPFHRQECFADLGAVDSHYPVANFAAEHSLALPIYPELSNKAIEYVVSTIAEFYR